MNNAIRRFERAVFVDGGQISLHCSKEKTFKSQIKFKKERSQFVQCVSRRRILIGTFQRLGRERHWWSPFGDSGFNDCRCADRSCWRGNSSRRCWWRVNRSDHSCGGVHWSSRSCRRFVRSSRSDSRVGRASRPGILAGLTGRGDGVGEMLFSCGRRVGPQSQSSAGRTVPRTRWRFSLHSAGARLWPRTDSFRILHSSPRSSGAGGTPRESQQFDPTGDVRRHQQQWKLDLLVWRRPTAEQRVNQFQPTEDQVSYFYYNAKLIVVFSLTGFVET